MRKKGRGAARKSVPQSEEELMEITKQALDDVLGREPTKQEVLRAHAGFKRMAFLIIDHLDRQEKGEKKKRQSL